MSTFSTGKLPYEPEIHSVKYITDQLTNEPTLHS